MNLQDKAWTLAKGAAAELIEFSEELHVRYEDGGGRKGSALVVGRTGNGVFIDDPDTTLTPHEARALAAALVAMADHVEDQA